jgi:hypothetical protein
VQVFFAKPRCSTSTLIDGPRELQGKFMSVNARTSRT